MISVLHTWGRILAAAGGVLGVLLAVPAFRFGRVWKICLRIAVFILILGLSMLLEEQILRSAGVSWNGLVRQPSSVGAVNESTCFSLVLIFSNKRFSRSGRLGCSRMIGIQTSHLKCGAV
jgi:hypothetical protein